MPKEKAFRFEDELKQIEELVNQLEDGNLPLDDAFKTFEAGVKRVKNCQLHLNKVEQKVSTIMEKNAEFLENPFMNEDDDFTENEE